MPNADAIINLALLNAVSPLVIGAATTPKTASIPPKSPNHPLHIKFTTLGAVKFGFDQQQAVINAINELAKNAGKERWAIPENSAESAREKQFD